MDYLVKIRSVQTPLNGQFSIGANSTWSSCNNSSEERGTDSIELGISVATQKFTHIGIIYLILIEFTGFNKTY